MFTCRDPEGWGPVSKLRQFDTAPCFQEGVLISGILALVFTLSSLTTCYTCVYKSALERTRLSQWQLRAKLILLFVAFDLSLYNATRLLTGRITVPVVQAYYWEPVALASIALFTFFNHTRTRRSSTILLFFWPIYVGVVGMWIRTYLSSTSRHPDKVLLLLKLSSLGAGVASYLLECAGPEVGLPRSNKVYIENPTLTASVYSIWTFSWMTPLMKKGSTAVITEDDLPPLKTSDQSVNLGKDLGNAMSKHPLWSSLFIAYGGPYAAAAILKVLQDVLAFAQPQLLRWLLSYISLYQEARFSPDVRPSQVEGFMIAGLMFVTSIIQTICLNQYFQRTFETGMRVRAGLVTAIYTKALVLSNDERSSRASGDIVNLMSVDATRLQDLCTYGLIALSGPFQITLAFVSLYNLLGWAAFVGVGIMVISIPLNTAIARVLKRMQEQQMKNRDKRTRLMSELLANIRSIKLYAWEYTFIRRITEVRNNQELKMLKKIGIITAGNMALWTGIPLLVAFCSFATAAATSTKPLTSDVIFPAISLFMLLQFPLAMFSQVTSNIIEAIVSIQRLSSFLNADELRFDSRKVLTASSALPGDEVLSIREGSFSWSKNSKQPTLEGITLSVKKGELIGVLGKVGAGKSSLLAAIIGEMTRNEGELTVCGSVAYAPQSPWILSASVRDNILFSHEYDETFYNLVIEGCALEQDLASMKQGDLTEVGEKGITLSGGQRARIGLARAIYARADLTLLDDCLAAVDSHVAQHVFDHIIGPQGLLSTKARVLVTNSISFAKSFNSLLFIRRGILFEQGSYEDLASNPNSEISKLLTGHRGSGDSSGSTTPISSGSSTPLAAEAFQERLLPVSETNSLSEKLRRRSSFQKATLAPVEAAKYVPPNSLSKEHQEQGQVKMEVYKHYIQAASKTGFALFLLATVAQQAVSVLATITLRYWGEHNQKTGSNSGMFRYLLFYGLFSLSSSLLGAASAILMWVYCALRSARQLHDSMLSALMHAPLSFFETTPTGRLLNLFSRDTYVVDQILARVIQGLCRTLAVCLSIIVVIGSSFPPFLLAVLPLGWFYLRVMRYYLSTSRELKRIDAVTRSPIFAWFSESLVGVSTIRAFEQQSVFIATNQKRVDHNQVCYLPSISVNRWLAVRLEFVGALIIFAVAVLAMFALVTSGVDAGLVGLVLSYALSTTSSLNWVVRSASEVEQNIVSVERILHQTQVQPEAPLEISDQQVPQVWPSTGTVSFENYSTRYRPELDLVLKNLSFKICGSEKIGVCGRTGAGKSSLLLALFRIIEPSSGSIWIDSVDITKIGLHTLRNVLSIVPQSPELFEGSLRENIDPLGVYSDVDIWTALEQAHLRDYVETLSEKLDSHVSEGGSSLSAGQRQLLCFARALLRKSKILVLDEATSAVDLDTDRAIQEIIRGEAFRYVTIITIAHRVNTILDSDRILVIDSGSIAEFDSPKTLLSNKNSLFYALVAKAGILEIE
ncbi:multidrug resistance-associated ABC transporter [Crepidotus variabilis]|uniref:Multidrug resistance-associated ABC transporter n=1 Tax=Crepidotus variabilis TaxID=179855 RepID=A0A9P6EBM7_9AGAR|nr:multidrug resistance-associated ABC transporter [Crepidotus variabilis]